MLTAIKGYYEGGRIVLEEDAPVTGKTQVIVTFLSESVAQHTGRRIPGGLKGRISIPDDFNDPQ